jgi:hypothetical protein
MRIEPQSSAAVTMISTLYWGEASLLSTQARHGVLPGATQASQTAFTTLKKRKEFLFILAFKKNVKRKEQILPVN